MFRFVLCSVLTVSLSGTVVRILPDNHDFDAPKGGKVGPRIDVFRCPKLEIRAVGI